MITLETVKGDTLALLATSSNIWFKVASLEALPSILRNSPPVKDRAKHVLYCIFLSMQTGHPDVLSKTCFPIHDIADMRKI